MDGDDYHPIQNINKMKRGIPLNDDERSIWLKVLNGLLKKESKKGVGGVGSPFFSRQEKVFTPILRSDINIGISPFQTSILTFENIMKLHILVGSPQF